MTEFIYNGEKYSTWNLKKELKKMGIKKEDVTVLEEERKPQPIQQRTNRSVVHWDPATNKTFWGYVSENAVPAYVKNGKYDVDAFMDELTAADKCVIWNASTRTGWGSWSTEEYWRSLVLLFGNPKMPLELGADGNPILSEVYEDWTR